jgi:hypothetical protein
MQTNEISKNIQQSLLQLTEYQQHKLLEFIEAMITGADKKTHNLRRFAGAIDPADLQKMQHAISEGCEKIDHDEW